MFPLSFVERSQVVEVKGADDTLTRISSNFKLVAPARPHQKTIFKIQHLSNRPHQKFNRKKNLAAPQTYFENSFLRLKNVSSEAW